MKELMKHFPAIKSFIEERTQAFQEISDNMVKNFLREAYKLPFLFPVRIIVSEEKFVNFLFEMRKELFEGKKIESTAPETLQEAEQKTTKQAETTIEAHNQEEQTDAKTESVAKKDTPTKTSKNKKEASNPETHQESKVTQSSQKSTKTKTSGTKKGKITA